MTHFAYLPYLALHAPVLGVVKGVVLAACICLLFPARPQPVGTPPQAGPLSAAERRLGLLLLATLALWMSCAGGGEPPRVKLAGAEAVPGQAGSVSADALIRPSNVNSAPAVTLL